MPKQNPNTRLKIILHVIFFLSGLATILIGQVLPILARQFSLNDLEVSYFFPAQFFGSITGTFWASRFARRDEHLVAATIGGFAIVVGLLMMNIEIHQFCLAAFFINGLGIGLTLPSINMTIVELESHRSGAALSILNFCWGVGAILSKPFVDVFSTANTTGITTYVLAVPLVISTLLLFFTKSEGKKVAATIGDDIEFNIPIWTTPLAWMIALFNFIHVGFESGLGGWLTTYAERLKGSSSVGWLSPTLLYFLFFVLGRGFASILFRWLDEQKMLFLGLAIVLVGVIAVLYAQSVNSLSLGAIVCGFGTSWIFPANISRFSIAFGPAAIRRATPVFLCGTFGAVVVTWLIGYVSQVSGSLRSGMFVLATNIVLLVLLQLTLTIWQRRKVSSKETI